MKIDACKKCMAVDPRQRGLFCVKYDKYCHQVTECIKRNKKGSKDEMSQTTV